MANLHLVISQNVYTPSNGQGEYDALTYQELQQQLEHCPPFADQQRVAIVIPAEQMADMAMTLLSVIAQGGVAVPLDPRMPPKRILEAMQQLQCTCLVATKDVLLEGFLLEKTVENTFQSSSLLQQELKAGLEEIRIVQGGICGRIQWTCLAKEGDDMWMLPTSGFTKQHTLMPTKETAPPPNKNSNSTAMLLRTSGTTNKPKVVPITHDHLIYAAVSIATALKLTRQDCNANSMPFYHIGGISCNLLAVLISGGSALLTGPLQCPNVFLDHILTNSSSNKSNNDAPTPTWYYAGPSMHKAIALMAEARYNANNQQPLPSQLRFIRSASAHLNHDLALQLSTLFGCQVIPTYGMSEAMPICSSAPIDVRNDPPCQVIDSVGYPTGTSVRIVDPETDQVLPYGSDKVGEICVQGAGVISNYIGLDRNKTHTADGWLRTGDHGVLDRQGRLFIKGRSKEMIKRGGEQVWPNEIDDVIEKVPGVATAVAFGVPNELWGEEVAVAVVLRDPSQRDNSKFLQQLNDQILTSCQENLDDLSTPQQIKFLASTDELLKGSTGKYIRSKMANHLNVTAVDTGALRVLSSVSQMQQGALLADGNANDQEQEEGKWDWLFELATRVLGFPVTPELLETKGKDGRRVIPSEALNGVRFLVSCFVVHVHVGTFPNLTWVKLQGYVPNMMIFFSLAGFQTTCQVARSVKGQWASWVGTKIGALHSLFVISQLITFPSYVFFHAFDDDGNLIWDAGEWAGVIVSFIVSTATGLGHRYDVNMFAWFQSALYIFLVFFPFLDHYFRYQTLKMQLIFLVVFGILSSGMWGILYLAVPSDFFFENIYPIGWTIISWTPLLLTSMLLAYMFLRLVEYYLEKQREEATASNDAEMQLEQEANGPDTVLAEHLKDRSQFWGKLCDLCSFVLLLIWIVVALWPNCLCVYNETFQAMRPNDPLPPPGCKMKSGQDEYGDVCGITYDEFVGFIQPDPNHFEFGRFVTNWAGAFGYIRVPALLFAIWIAFMAFGHGYTARIFESKLLTKLSTLGYPVYLMQMAVARYYWLATRGFERQYWWGVEGEHPFPVEWWEFFIVLFITIVVGGVINEFIVPLCMPHSISLGVRVCTWLSWFAKTVARRFGMPMSEDTDDEPADGKEVKIRSSYTQVKEMVRGLTGVDVTSDMPLRHLGLDSLGAAALLGTLRASVASARKLTLRQLQDCETVGDLSSFLDRGSTTTLRMDSSEDSPSVSAGLAGVSPADSIETESQE